MQHLCVVVTEMYVAQLYCAVLRRLRVSLRSRQLFRGENIRNLRDDSAYLSEIIRELHAADYRRRIESITMMTNFSGESVPFFISIPPMGSTVRRVEGIIFMAKVK